MSQTLPTAVNTAETVQRLYLAGQYARRAICYVGRLRFAVDARQGKGKYVVLPTESARLQLCEARASLVQALAEVDALAAQLGEAP